MTATDHAALIERLSAPFPAACLKSVDKGGRSLTYVPGSEVISRLNTVLGNRWSWVTDEITYAPPLAPGFGDAEREGGAYPQYVVARGTLTIEWPDGTTQRMGGTGGTTVKRLRESRLPVDLGDEVKGAETDALKKAAQRIGVAMDLARDEEAAIAAQRADDDTQGRQAATADTAAEKDALAVSLGFADYATLQASLADLKADVEAIAIIPGATEAWQAWRQHVTAGQWPPSDEMLATLEDRVADLAGGDVSMPPTDAPQDPEASPDAPAPTPAGEQPWLPTVVAALADLKGARKSACTRMRRTAKIGDDPAQWTDDQARAVLDFIAGTAA
jgi:hypothetical protein